MHPTICTERGFYMAQNRDHDRTKKEENIEELINEASEELGVDLNTKSIQEDPKSFAQRIKQAIRRRTR